MRKAKEIFDELHCWAEDNDQIRGLVLSSSRVDGEAPTDLLSDYDVVLFVTDQEPYGRDDDWLETFGPVMTRWPPRPTWTEEGEVFRLVIYEDGVRIDWGIAKAERMAERIDTPEPYRVLIDKDNRVKNPVKPYHGAYNVPRPSESEYDELVSDFWWDITYVAKSLWRDELYWAKYMNRKVHFPFLEKVIEWYIGMQHSWAVTTNKHGRWFKRYMDTGTWAEVESTFSGADLQENWDALFNATRLFRRLAVAVADGLNYDYPHETDRRVTEYMLKIKRLDRDAEDFV